MHISIQLLQAKCILWNDKWIPPLMFFFLEWTHQSIRKITLVCSDSACVIQWCLHNHIIESTGTQSPYTIYTQAFNFSDIKFNFLFFFSNFWRPRPKANDPTFWTRLIMFDDADHRIGNLSDDASYWESFGPVWKESHAHFAIDSIDNPTR